MLGVRPEHIELTFERGVRASVDSVEYLGGDSLVACRIGDAAARGARRRAASALSRGDATWLDLGAWRTALFRCAGWRTPCGIAAHAGDAVRVKTNDFGSTEFHRRKCSMSMIRIADVAAAAACALALIRVAALAQAPVEVSFYYPVAVGGPITKIIDGFAADFEKENPGHQAEADLLRQLPGLDHQGADRGEERRARR